MNKTVVIALAIGVSLLAGVVQCTREVVRKSAANREGMQRIRDFARRVGGDVEIGGTYKKFFEYYAGLKASQESELTAWSLKELKSSVLHHLKNRTIVTVATIEQVEGEFGRGRIGFECVPINCPYRLVLRCNAEAIHELEAYRFDLRDWGQEDALKALTLAFRVVDVDVFPWRKTLGEGPRMIIYGSLKDWEATGRHWPFAMDALDQTK